MRDHLYHHPLITAGLLMGAGLGGFVDGIFFHQILQWHNMLSARMPPNTLVNAKINMFWDGVFHASVWVMTVYGLAVLWRAGQRSDVPWSGKTFLGSLFAGWGLFNMVEGLMDHQLLGLHHVHEYASHPGWWDAGYLVMGVILWCGGWALVHEGRLEDAPTRGG